MGDYFLILQLIFDVQPYFKPTFYILIIRFFLLRFTRIREIFYTKCNLKYHSYRSLKSSLKALLFLPAWEALSAFWKSEILAEIKLVWKDLENGRRQLCGVMMDPREFFPLYLGRFLLRRELEGDLPAAGNYEIEVKVTYCKAMIVERKSDKLPFIVAT